MRMATRGTSGPARRASEHASAKLGLRFDRGRTELVLDAPISLADGVRLDAMRTELAPLEGRLSLTEGWRAFRHRRSTLRSATVSLSLRELAAMIGRAIGLETEVIALGASVLSVTASNEALAVAAELEWGWDDEDLLVVVGGARSLPLGPRAPLALVHDLALSAGATFDRLRGALRFARPLRHVLKNALVPAGLRIPSASGLSLRASVEGDRLVLSAEHVPGGRPEPSRATLERARASADAIARCVEEGGEAPSEASTIATLVRALHVTLARESIDAGALARAAEEYAGRERHASMASRALLLAAERGGAGAWRLAVQALERNGLSHPSALARAIELAASGGASSGTQLPWERLARSLEAGSSVVARGRALALERAGRMADALAGFAEIVRAEPHDVVALGGIARCLAQLGRHDEALSAWDRLAEVAEPDGAAEARFAAALHAQRAGHAAAAIDRLRAIVASEPPGVRALDAHHELAASLHLHVGLDAARALDRGLSSITDVVAGLDPLRAATSLRAAIDRAVGAPDVALGRSHLRALERVLGPAGAAELASLEELLAGAVSRALTEGDPATLRARADVLRSEGRNADAARVLIEVFAATKDAAALRAAIELADRAPDAAARLAVFDRALALLPAGPARDAIAARR